MEGRVRRLLVEEVGEVVEVSGGVAVGVGDRERRDVKRERSQSRVTSQ